MAAACLPPGPPPGCDTGARLSYAYLNGNVTLGHARLAGTDLSYADLRDAGLAGADLGSVNLTGTDLAGADLTGADLPPPPDPEVAGSPPSSGLTMALPAQDDEGQDRDTGGVTDLLGMFTTEDANEATAGALAIDPDQGTAWGWAAGYADVADAKRRALEECGEGCRIVMSFEDGCAAYAADQKQGSTVRGWSFGFDTGVQAEVAALEECRKRGGLECIVRVWACGA